MRCSQHKPTGSALVIVMIIMVVIIVLCMATLAISSSEVRSAAVAKQRVQALFVAEAGVELHIQAIRQMLDKTGLAAPFGAIDALAGTTPITAEPMTKDGTSVGQFTVTITAVEAVGDATRYVTVHSQGFVPSADAPNKVTRTVTATLRVQVGRSGVFDHVYFINNWGWFYGDTIHADGNVRANGQFDCATYTPTIDGVPVYESVEGADLQGLVSEGGIYAGWDIIADDVKGTAKQTWTQEDADAGDCTQEQVGTYKYQYGFLDQIPMPNLTDLSLYEEAAKNNGSWIKAGDEVVCGPVLGDDPGEPQHLYLEGTKQDPIEISGLVVIRGSVIISGVVTGQGSIYAGGNIYVPKNLEYENAPQPLPSPSTRTESALENWLDHNNEKDSLGLFAREHIVVGDYTNGTWQSYVNSWIHNSKNKSKEDAGLDLIPNTRAGRDGILGTADDDVLEDDGVWTVDHYTQEDADHGLIPSGKQVGDVIPGSGEDIDGDGQYDGTTSLTEFNIPASLTTTDWAGNVPAGTPSYGAISTMEVHHLDAAFYTNHAIAMVTLASNKHLNINGCIISRNESIIYGTKSLRLNYDYRLMRGGGQFGLHLPKVLKPIEVLLWTSD